MLYHEETKKNMLSTFQSVLSKALRAGGQSLDTLGRTFEVFPYIEKCKFIYFLHIDRRRMILVYFIDSDSLYFFFFFFFMFGCFCF